MVEAADDVAAAPPCSSRATCETARPASAGGVVSRGSVQRSVDRSAVVVLGETGHGKTVLLAHLIQAWLEGAPGAGRAELLSDGEEKRRRSLAAIEAFPAPGRRTTSQAVAAITSAFADGQGIEGTQEPEDFFVEWQAGDLAPGRSQVLCLRDVPGYVFEEGERWERRGARWGEFLQGCAGLLLVLDLDAALEAAEASRFAARIHRYVHALSAAEAAARRAGVSALPVVLCFARADRAPRPVRLEELRASPALRPLFAALDDPSRRLATTVQIVSCLRLAREEGAADRSALASALATLGAGLARGFVERAAQRRRRLRLGAVLGGLLLYGAWAAFAAWSLRERVEPDALVELQDSLRELEAYEDALARFGAFPWWPGKDHAAYVEHRAVLEARAVALLRDHPALREEEGRCERTRAEYATARRALERLRSRLDARAPLPPGPEPREELLRAKEELARLEAPSARNLHEWEAAWRATSFLALRAEIEGRLRDPLTLELERVDASSRKVDLQEELRDLGSVRAFRAAHAGIARELVEGRLAREWSHVSFVLERARASGAEPLAQGSLLPLATAHAEELAAGPEASRWLLGEIAFELGRTLALGVRADERAALAERLAEGTAGAGLVRALALAVPRVYAEELLRWNGAEGRPFLARRAAGLADLALLLRPHAASVEARSALADFEAHLARLVNGKIGPYRLWLRRLVTDVGDEPFWMRLPALDEKGRFLRWNEFGGLAQPVLRLVRAGEDAAPFDEGVLAPGTQGWMPLARRWEGRVAIGGAFEHEAGRGLRVEIADRGTAEHPRPAWLAWVVFDAAGAFAPERLDACTLEIEIDRAEGGSAEAKKPEQRYHPRARQVLRLEFEVELADQPLRDASAAFSFSAWTSSW